MTVTDASLPPGFSTSSPGFDGSPALVGVTTHASAGAIEPPVAPPSLPTPIVRTAATTGAPSLTARSIADAVVVTTGYPTADSGSCACSESPPAGCGGSPDRRVAANVVPSGPIGAGVVAPPDASIGEGTITLRSDCPAPVEVNNDDAIGRSRGGKHAADAAPLGHDQGRGRDATRGHIDRDAQRLFPLREVVQPDRHAPLRTHGDVGEIGVADGRPIGGEQRDVEDGIGIERVHHHEEGCVALTRGRPGRIPRSRCIGSARLRADTDLAFRSADEPSGGDPAAEGLHERGVRPIAGRHLNLGLTAGGHGHLRGLAGAIGPQLGHACEHLGLARIREEDGALVRLPSPVGTQPRRRRGRAGDRRRGLARSEALESHGTDGDHAREQEREHPLTPSPHRDTGFLVTHSATAQSTPSIQAWIVAGSCAP